MKTILIIIIIGGLIVFYKSLKQRIEPRHPFIDEYEEEFIIYAKELSDYLSDFKSPVLSANYDKKLLNAINANKKVLIAFRQYDPYNKKIVPYELALEYLLTLENKNFKSLHERRLACRAVLTISKIQDLKTPIALK